MIGLDNGSDILYSFLLWWLAYDNSVWLILGLGDFLLILEKFIPLVYGLRICFNFSVELSNRILLIDCLYIIYIYS